VADHPRRYLGDCLVHTLTNNISLVLIRVLAMLASFLSFSADDSPMYTYIRLCALVSCICANFIG
jgi:flagellar biosynthesis protein FliR